MSNEIKNDKQRFSPFRNWISLIGMVLSLGSLFSFAMLFTMDVFAKESNPYLGILTFVAAPAFLALGVFMMIGGWLFSHRRLVKQARGESPLLLSIDFSRPDHRRNFVVFAVCAMVFLLVSALGSYHSFHFAESVAFCGQTCHVPMKPEHATYLVSPHARVGCTECHVGPGAVSFIKAKLNGVTQLKNTLLSSFPRPIETPHNLSPAQDTCERCHWPKKYYGDVEQTFTRFLSDETNTAYTARLVMKVGGGDATHGPVGGIHWHMNLGNKVEYITTKADRQVIPWVRFTNAKGEQTVYQTSEFKDDPAKSHVRTMDCMDCHNRPAHQFRSASDSADLALSLKKIDSTLPFIKSNLVAILSHTNATEAEGLAYIDSSLKKAYPKADAKLIAAAIKETQESFSNSIFPEMKADWRRYPNNIGHKNWPGCFRCHDGKHKTGDGKKKIEASDCNSCHLILAQGAGEELGKLNPKGLAFAHPDSASEGKDPDCVTCHGAGE